MDDELTSSYSRWLDADESGSDEEGDAALSSIFRAAPRTEPVSLTFTSRTMEAIAAEAARNARRTARTRRAAAIAAGLGTVAAAYFGAGSCCKHGDRLLALSTAHSGNVNAAQRPAAPA